MTNLFLSGAMVLCLAACASSEIKPTEFRQIDPQAIRVRRPPGEGADPKAGPGGLDFQSQPKPDSRLDCRRLEELFDGIAMDRVRACLNQIQELTDEKGKIEIEYELRLSATPEYELAIHEDRPTCLDSLLPKLPVPREMVFVAENLERQTRWCYSSRLNIEDGIVLGVKLPKKGKKLVLQFPIAKVPESDSETLRTLGAWVLTPFFSAEAENSSGESIGAIPGSVLTDQLCEACFEGKVPKKDPANGLWP